MSLRTVRLEADAERALDEIQRATGLSASAAIRQGVISLREQLRKKAEASPFEIYASLDLGKGGYAKVPARRAKRGIAKTLRKKHAK